jgi:hypothetical protein
VSTLESFFASIGLLWERLHIISAGTVRTPGVTSAWTQDLVPIGTRAIAAGELVELRTTLDKDHPIADTAKIRFDILEFDWLFSGGFDDPVATLKLATADPPDGAFAVVERVLLGSDLTTDRPTLRAVVDSYRVQHSNDYERRILVVKDASVGTTDLITWWRATYVPDSGDGPTLYFVSEIPQRRSSGTVPLKVAAPAPGVNVRLVGKVRDVVPAALADAQPVPDAVVSVAGQAGRTARTTALGEFVLDVRAPPGTSTVTVARPGIDTRTLRITVTERSDAGFDVAVLDADAGNASLATGTLAHDADDQAIVLADVPLRARVHRLVGQVVWPQTWAPAAGQIPLAGRYVYAIPLAAGAALPQRPKTSRDWDALRTRSGVLRSARPDQPTAHAATDAGGGFEICFVDLRPGNQYLLWVEGGDPRTADTRVSDVIVRTTAAPAMRRLAFPGGTLAPERTDRMVVDSTYNLMADDVAGATEVIRIVDAAAAGAPANLRILRPGRVNPAGFDATPVAGPEVVEIDDATRKSASLRLEVLPLVPVFEPADQQGVRAHWATRTLHEQLDGHYPQGHLGTGIRWVLDARRGPTPLWNDADACAALETTLLSHPLLTKAHIDAADWRWWRCDAVSAADFARVRLGVGELFAGRVLVEELVPVLTGPAARLLALFENRHVHVSPGHGVYQQPPVGYAVRSNRTDWAGIHPPTAIQNWAGEDENTAAIAMAVRSVADANGVSITVSRESLDPTRPGTVQDGTNFAEVDSVLHPDHPRLWQQNAYYWIATEWDAHPVGAPIVVGHAVTSAAPVGTQDPIDAAGINARLALFRREADPAGPPIDAFMAVHTNGAGVPNRRGWDVMYLDVRQTPASPAPGAGGYVEGNAMSLDAAVRLSAGISAEVQMPTDPAGGGGARSYWAANGSTATELNSSFHHFRDGTAVRGMRALVDTVPPSLAEVNFPPPAGGPDHPVTYLELGFHSSPEDAACLSQGWFRYAGGTGIAVGLADIVGHYSRDVSADDTIALLRRTFGAIPSVTALTGGAIPLTAAAIGALVGQVTGHAPTIGSAALEDVVTAIETERATVTRGLLARQVADAVALRAGWTGDPARAGDRARAAYRPVLEALGAAPFAAAAVPDIATVPRAAVPATRADAAAVLAAALGLRPATLPTVTAAIRGTTVLAAAVPESPEAFVASPALAAVVTAIGTLAPLDVLRLAAVRLVDAHGIALPVPYRVVAGDGVALAVDTIGTSWRGGPSDVGIVVTRANAPVATLSCAARSASTLTSAQWVVPLPGVAGAQSYAVTARIVHPSAGALTLGPVEFSLEVTS